jgi:GNAT superfamily N-acetyltransferase
MAPQGGKAQISSKAEDCALSTDSSPLEVHRTLLTDPAAEPLLAGLLVEYTERYGEVATAEFAHHPPEVFNPDQGGALILLIEQGRTVAGGAFRRFERQGLAADVLPPAPGEPPTAEFKRIWTHAEHRRRGLARRVLAELEREAAEAGYTRVFLTTGPRQPEAVGLYLATGYTELPDPGAAERGYPFHPFVKDIAEL